MPDMKDQISDAEKFDFMEMFNQIVTLDDNFAGRLPQEEFELAFDASGNIYINGQPMGVNVKRLYDTLQVR